MGFSALSALIVGLLIAHLNTVSTRLRCQRRGDTNLIAIAYAFDTSKNTMLGAIVGRLADHNKRTLTLPIATLLY